MKKKHRLTEKKEKTLLLNLSKELGVDMQKVIKPAKHYAQFFYTPRECSTFEQLDAYVHGNLIDVEKVEQHIRECKRCFHFTELIKKHSLKLHPENSKFELFWEKRGSSISCTSYPQVPPI